MEEAQPACRSGMFSRSFLEQKAKKSNGCCTEVNILFLNITVLVILPWGRLKLKESLKKKKDLQQIPPNPCQKAQCTSNEFKKKTKLFLLKL